MMQSGLFCRRYLVRLLMAISLFAFITLLAMTIPFSGTDGEETEGGTDDELELLLDYGEDDGWDWNVLGAFVILENGAKIEESYNISLSTGGMVWDNESSHDAPEGRYQKTGHILGKITFDHWMDNPLNITVSEQDFEEHSEDGHTLNVTVYGEYTRTIENESRLRQVFTTVTIERPKNRAPVPVIAISIDNQVTWIDVMNNSLNNISVSSYEDHNVFFNLSGSFDPDGDTVHTWTLNIVSPFEEMGEIFTSYDSLPENASQSMIPDVKYRFEFTSEDSLGMPSEEFKFRVVLSTFHLQPDLSFSNITPDNLFPEVDEDVNISVEIMNAGVGKGRYVYVEFRANDKVKHFAEIKEIGPLSSEMITIPFYPRDKEHYDLHFTLLDNDPIDNESMTVYVGYSIPFVYIESPRDDDEINTTSSITGTVSFDEDSLDEIPIEASVQGGEWGIVTYCTDGKHWDFELNASDHVNDTILILVRAFDGRQYSENASVVVDVVEREKQTNSSKEKDKDSDDSTPSPSLIAGGILIFGTLGLGGLAFLREDLRFALYSIFVLPLYSKIRRDDVLREGYRQDIYQYVVSQPGASLTTIKQELGIGHGTVIHHLTVLEDNHKIRSKKEFGRRLFFPQGNGNGNSSSPSVSNSPELSLIQKRIRDHIKYSGPKTQSEIVSELGIKKQTVSYTLQRLQMYGFVRGEGEGRGARYHAVETPLGEQNS